MILYISLFSVILFGEEQKHLSKINRRELKFFAQRKSTEWKRKRAEAEVLAIKMGLPVRQVFSDGTICELQHFEHGCPIYYITTSLTAAKTISTDKVWPGGIMDLDLDGNGFTFGIWDGGSTRDSHCELIGRVTNLDTTQIEDHPTHITGIMIATGIKPIAKGMAYKSDARVHDYNDDVREMSEDQLLPNPIIVSNHSYAHKTGWYDYNRTKWGWAGNTSIDPNEDYKFGFYHQKAADFDSITYLSPYYTIVTAAGNFRLRVPPSPCEHFHLEDGQWHTDTHPANGDPDGYDTIAGGAPSAKNIITVGAVRDIPEGFSQPADVILYSYSGCGPTDDGRIKPDIVANGLTITSAGAAHDNHYFEASGTSDASATVAGSIGLLNQHTINLFGQLFKASIIKAIIIHAADEAGIYPGPDFKFGWGLMNTAAAADLISTHSRSQRPFFNINELALTNGDTIEFDFESLGSDEIKATIVWTDPPGIPPMVAVDPPDIMLVNDIDLRIIGPAGIHEPWIMIDTLASTGDNIRDNIEQIVIAEPLAGTYTVRITHKGTLFNNESQVVSLIITEEPYYNPILEWRGITNYINDGLSPEVGSPTTNFKFLIQYHDDTGEYPMSEYPKLHLLKNGFEIEGSPFRMTNEGVSTDGDIFFKKNIYDLEPSDNYTYYFEAYDALGYKAFGTGTEVRNGPNVYNDLVFAKIKVFLQGPYLPGGSMITSLIGVIPNTSPYSDERSVNPIPPNIVDWVYVELRTIEEGAAVTGRSFFLRNDGMIVDDNGTTSDLPFIGLSTGDYFIVIRQRNHLCVMSATAQSLNSSPATLYDFSTGTPNGLEKYYGKEAVLLEAGVYGMYCGDIDQDGEVTTTDYMIWYNSARIAESGYKVTDIDCDCEVTNSDYLIWYNNARIGVSSKVPDD